MNITLITSDPTQIVVTYMCFVIPGLEKDLRTGKYKPETDDSIRTADPQFLSTLDEAIRTFGNMSDFTAINLLHSHSIWEKALEQSYNKPFPQELFLKD